MAGFEYDYRAKFPERTLRAKVCRVEKIGEGSRGRTSYEFDCLDIRFLDRSFPELAVSQATKPFALLRILTTEHRFKEVFNTTPEVGDWYQIELAQRKTSDRRLTVWHSQLTAGGYTDQSRGYAGSVELLSRADEPPPSTLGAAAVRDIDNFPSSAIARRSAIATTLRKLKKPNSILVRDVGQASFVSLLSSSGKAMLHFDAGWPLTFNGKSAPQKSLVLHKNVPVILSHWDWDHLHSFYKFPVLQKATWICPIQPLGYGQARIAWQLHHNGNLLAYSGGFVRGAWGEMGLCLGPVSDCNQSGLALRVSMRDGRQVLLVGDADYERVPRRLRRQPLHGLVVTHHGANFIGSVPRPLGKRPCVVSVGKPNVYKHPKSQAVRRHKSKLWQPIATASIWGMQRGDRLL